MKCLKRRGGHLYTFKGPIFLLEKRPNLLIDILTFSRGKIGRNHRRLVGSFVMFTSFRPLGIDLQKNFHLFFEKLFGPNFGKDFCKSILNGLKRVNKQNRRLAASGCFSASKTKSILVIFQDFVTH